MARVTIAPQGFRAVLPPPLPDLVVQSISASPAAPTAGDQVTFTAVVKNQGLGPTTGNIGLLFEVDGNSVNWTTDTTGPLAAGATRTLTATAGVSGAYWASTSGTHTVRATVNDTLAIPETDVTNNDRSVSLTVAALTTGGSGYGPVGNEWTTLFSTPTMSDPITVTIAVDDYAGLNAAIAAHANDPGKVVIALANGTWSGGSSNPINDVAGLSSRTSNILIRPVTIGGVVNSAQWRVHASCVTLAHFVGGGWYADSPTKFAAVNNVLNQNTQCTTNVGDTYEIVGNVKPNKGTTDSDCLQVNSTNGLWRRNWIEGRNRATTGHCDVMQVLGHGGFLKIQNQYHGGGGVGQQSTFFFKEDAQSPKPQPAIQISDTFFGAANNDCYIELDGNGETITLTNVVSQNKILLRLRTGAQAWDPTYVPTTASGCKAQTYSYVDSTGKLILSNPTPGVTLVASPGPAVPTFSPPTWWNHAWDTV